MCDAGRVERGEGIHILKRVVLRRAVCILAEFEHEGQGLPVQLHGKVVGGIMRGLWGFQRALGLFFAVFGGALAGLSLLSGRPNLLTVMGAAMLYFGIRQFRKKEAAEGVKSRAAQRVFQENVTDTPMRFTFEEDGFYVWEPSGSASYRYHALDAVWEDGERDYLILPGKQWWALQKSAFTKGDPAGFRDFIESKTGKAVEIIK